MPDPLTAPQAPAAIAGSNGPDDSRRQVATVAAQFEAILVGNLLQQLRASIFETGTEGARTSSAPLADTLFAELALALCRAGGVGVAEALAAPLGRQIDRATPHPSPVGAAGVPAEQAASRVPFAWLPGRVSSPYGWRRDPLDDATRFHRGIDIALSYGQTVPAPRSGIVTFAGNSGALGQTVVVDHGGGITTRYSHLSGIDVQVGQTIEAGRILGRVGASGRATGPHLHFEVLDNGTPVNPAVMLDSIVQTESQDRN